MLEMRDRLVRDGVVINALAIEEHNDDLTSYFYRFLIGGPAAFVITADEFDDFRVAMRKKLYREIVGRSCRTRGPEAMPGWIGRGDKANVRPLRRRRTVGCPVHPSEPPR